jgi:transposase
MSKHKVGLSRTQTALLPPTLDDYAAAGAVVRVIDQYVSGLDLAGLGFTHSVAAHTGASSYAAADLLKLYLYGYFNRLRHSRQLERECKRNVEVMWLLGQLTPCFKTIAAFRSDNAKAFEAVCAQFVAFLREFQLLGGKLPVVAVDGSKFKACASKRSVMTPEQLERERKRIRRYLEEMDEADAHDEGVPELTPEQFEAALEKLKERNKKLEQAQAELAARAEAGAQQGTPRASLTDPDAVLLKGAGAEALAGYNVQQAVEAQHGFIVAHEVTTERNDHTSLAPMAIKAQEALKAAELTVITDCGYANGAQSQLAKSWASRRWCRSRNPRRRELPSVTRRRCSRMTPRATATAAPPVRSSLVTSAINACRPTITPATCAGTAGCGRTARAANGAASRAPGMRPRQNGHTRVLPRA